MDADEVLAEAAQSWLAASGTTGIYHSRVSGPTVVPITIEKNIETLDDQGLMRRMDIATVPSGVVDLQICDTVEIDGVLWEVLGLVDDPGHLARFYVGPA